MVERPAAELARSLEDMDLYPDFEPIVRLKSALAISPDGSSVAYIDDSQGQFNLVVRSLSGGSPRHLTSYTESSVGDVSWAPDGRSLLYRADTNGDEHHHLFLIDDLSRVSTQLTERLPGHRYWPAEGHPFSPDGRFLAYTGNDRSPGDQDVLIRDLNSGTTWRAYQGGGRFYAGHWSPDGARLTLIDGNVDDALCVMTIADGTVRRLTPEHDPATYTPGPWLPDGSGVLVLTDAGRETTGLGVLNVESGQLSWLDTPDWNVEHVALSHDGRTLAWLVNVDGASQLRARDLTTDRDVVVPAIPLGVASALQLTPDGRRAVLVMSTPTSPTNLLVVDLGDGAHKWLTDSRPAADTSGFVQPVLVHCPTDDGRYVPAYLYRPATTDRPVPAVLAIHGGPPVQERPEYSNDGLFQFLASRGVAVLAPNVRGSSGYGTAYEKAVQRDWGGVDVDDLNDAVEYLKAQSWIDPARIGIVGRSYGGFGVLSCVSRLPHHNWAAAVAWCAPSNLVTFTRAQPPAWRTKVAAWIGDPDTDAEFLMSRSPVTYADKIMAPLFLIQGGTDLRVPPHESEQIVQQLRARGLEVRYDVYPDEGHFFGRRANQTKARTDAAAFLLDHLIRGSMPDSND